MRCKQEKPLNLIEHSLFLSMALTNSSISKQLQILKEKFTVSLGLPFRELLPETMIFQVLATEKITYRQRLFDPFVTLWTFLSQVLDTDKSCANAESPSNCMVS